MQSEQEYYEAVDLKVYREEIAPVLPPQVLDIHTHVWPNLVAARNRYGPASGLLGIREHYTCADLAESGKMFFPDRPYHAVCFGAAFPESVDAGANEVVSREARPFSQFYPLMIAGPSESEERLRKGLFEGSFYGFKVAVNLEPKHYATDRITYVFSEAQRKLASELGLMVMLHIPRGRRLADLENVADLQSICRENPQAKIILAHLGRAYCSWVIKDSIKHLKDIPNLYWDVSYVQNETVMQILFENVDSSRVMFGTDQPLAEIRGRRVCINNDWVDVTRDPYAWAAFRRPGEEIQATFIAYEIMRAMMKGAEMAGLSRDKLRETFFDNGMRLIEDVRRRLTHQQGWARKERKAQR